MGDDVHALQQVKAMRAMAVHPRVEVHAGAAMLAGFRHQPVEELTSETGAAVCFARHEIIHEKMMTP